MALTLTEERRVAWKIEGIGPDPAHTLVVFRKAGTGKALHRVLRPGEVLKRRWLESPDVYLAYAVSKDENLRHSFSRKYQAVGQTWTFTLHFDLDFQVSEPELLAPRLEGDDPLRRVEEEVAKVLGATARHLPWDVLRRESLEFGLHLLESESTEGSGAKKVNFKHLQDFAAKLGLFLRHVDVTRSLTEADLKVELKEKDVGLQLGVEAAQARLEIGREHLKHQGEKLRTELAWERQLDAAQRRQTLEGIERLKAVLDSITKEGVRGFSQAVDGVRSFAAINDALLEVRTIQSSLMALSAGPGSLANPALGGADSLLLPGTSASGRLTVEPRRPSDPLERLVTDAFQNLRVLDGNPTDKRHILATVLHLLAEAGLGREGDEDYQEVCVENLKQQLYPLESALGEEALDFLRSVTDIEKLKLELAGNG